MGYNEKIGAGDGPAASNLSRFQSVSPMAEARTALGTLTWTDIDSIATKLTVERRRRHDLFDAQLFADPAWDILLIMTIAESRQHRLTVSKLCERMNAPTTTALRWIRVLTENGLLVRRDDPTDKRRKFIELSPHALSRMIEYCSSAIPPSRFAA